MDLWKANKIYIAMLQLNGRIALPKVVEDRIGSAYYKAYFRTTILLIGVMIVFMFKKILELFVALVILYDVNAGLIY